MKIANSVTQSPKFIQICGARDRRRERRREGRVTPSPEADSGGAGVRVTTGDDRGGRQLRCGG
jgi:hypothetical protein